MTLMVSNEAGGQDPGFGARIPRVRFEVSQVSKAETCETRICRGKGPAGLRLGLSSDPLLETRFLEGAELDAAVNAARWRA